MPTDLHANSTVSAIRIRSAGREHRAPFDQPCLFGCGCTLHVLPCLTCLLVLFALCLLCLLACLDCGDVLPLSKRSISLIHMQYRLMQRVQAQAWLKGLHFAVPASTEKRGSHSDRPKAHETFCAQPAEVANEPEPARAHEMNSMLKRHCHGPCAPYVYNRSRRADLVNHAARQLKPRRYQQAYRAFAITALDYDALLFDCDGVLVDTGAPQCLEL